MIELIEPDWPAPATIRAFCTTRAGGFSEGIYASWNLAEHVGDASRHVAQNRALLADLLPADACWTDAPGMATAVLTADCLPVLFCNFEGTLVAAVHAGWRGLSAGVLEATVAALPVPAQELLAWLGPAIGASAYEVGPEVRAAFLAVPESGGGSSETDPASAFLPNPAHDGHFYADLNKLARLRLQAVGIRYIYGGEYCTFSDRSRFFSHRRDGQTGRMASLICINRS